MALDSKQKRGSATEFTMPHRQWLAEPDTVLDAGDRLSILKLCSAISPSPPPVPVAPFVSEAYLYDATAGTGSIAGATIQSSDVIYDVNTGTGSIAGATIQSPDVIYDN